MVRPGRRGPERIAITARVIEALRLLTSDCECSGATAPPFVDESAGVESASDSTVRLGVFNETRGPSTSRGVALRDHHDHAGRMDHFIEYFGAGQLSRDIFDRFHTHRERIELTSAD